MYLSSSLFSFAGGSTDLRAFYEWVVSFTANCKAFVSSGTRVALAYASVEVDAKGLPVEAALWVVAGPGVYKGHYVVTWAESKHMLQNADGRLCPENALFHSVGSMSDHLVRRLLAAFFLNPVS